MSSPERWRWLAEMTSLSSLCETFNHAALAAHSAGDGLEPRGKEALRSARELLLQLGAYSSHPLPEGRRWDAQPPLAVFDAVADAFGCVAGSERFKEQIDHLVEDVEAVASGGADDLQSQSVETLFGYLAETALIHIGRARPRDRCLTSF